MKIFNIYIKHNNSYILKSLSMEYGLTQHCDVSYYHIISDVCWEYDINKDKMLVTSFYWFPWVNIY